MGGSASEAVKLAIRHLVGGYVPIQERSAAARPEPSLRDPDLVLVAFSLGCLFVRRDPRLLSSTGSPRPSGRRHGRTTMSDYVEAVRE
jgi:hypothetical protein